MSKIKGSCLCGAVRLEAQVDQPQTMSCYCADCQRCTGSACATFVVVPVQAMTLEGETRSFTKKSDEDRDVTRSFCPECGSQLYSEVEAMPGMRFVKVGILDSNDDLAPTVALWTDSKPSWAEIGEVAASFPRQPGG